MYLPFREEGGSDCRGGGGGEGEQRDVREGNPEEEEGGTCERERGGKEGLRASVPGPLQGWAHVHMCGGASW